MRKVIVLVLALLSSALPVLAGECFYMAEAHVMNEHTRVRTIYVSDIVELSYPPGSSKCEFDANGNYFKREEKLRDQFFLFLKAKKPGLVISDVQAKWFSKEAEIRFLYKLLSEGKLPDPTQSVILVPGSFYKE